MSETSSIASRTCSDDTRAAAALTLLYPALDITAADHELLYALLDDFLPTAIEERPDGLRAFFGSSTARDAALAALESRFPVAAASVPDEDWARRSQQHLLPVTIGRVTIAPNPEASSARGVAIGHDDGIAIVIAPSMGFGTGHHATTRLCVEALQNVDLRGRTVLDVGTGSGVLAIVASRLGAARVVGIDSDPDAVRSARDNLALNSAVSNVTFVHLDVGCERLPPVHVLTANLTGALLERSAPVLLTTVLPGGTLILSGLTAGERDPVVRAFGDGVVTWERHEDEWVGLSVKKG